MTTLTTTHHGPTYWHPFGALEVCAQPPADDTDGLCGCGRLWVRSGHNGWPRVASVRTSPDTRSPLVVTLEDVLPWVLDSDLRTLAYAAAGEDRSRCFGATVRHTSDRTAIVTISRD